MCLSCSSNSVSRAPPLLDQLCQTAAAVAALRVLWQSYHRRELRRTPAGLGPSVATSIVSAAARAAGHWLYLGDIHQVACRNSPRSASAPIATNSTAAVIRTGFIGTYCANLSPSQIAGTSANSISNVV